MGVEGRGGYYESAGVLRDMIQNHMFQLLSLVAMEPPWSFDAAPVRDEKVKVLNAIRPMQPEEILQRTVRGQYGEGFIDGQKLVAYRAEPSVAPDLGDRDVRRVEAGRGQLAVGGGAVLPALRQAPRQAASPRS